MKAGVSLYLKDLRLVNFRNFKHQELTFEPGVFIIQGANGQGKSNLLESIYVLCFGRSYRTRKELDLIYWNDPFYYLKGHVYTDDRLYRLEVGYEVAKKRKVVKLNGRVNNKHREDIFFPVVFFVPEDLELVRRGPEERRKFMDLEISQFDPIYANYLARYKKALFQKNRLLKENRPGSALENMLRPWNEQLIYFGSRVAQKRYQFLVDLNRLAAKNYSHLFQEELQLSIMYHSFMAAEEFEHEIEIVEKNFRLEMDKIEGEEKKRGFCLIGPHKDDLVFLLNGREARRFASHGQQRGVVISLKAAQIQFYNENDKKPIFLLDDIFSELDEMRREQCFSLFDQAGQVFLSITRKENYMEPFLKRFENRFFYSVEKGQVTVVS